MNEATSELNATVVVVMAIGVLMAFFYYTIWPIINSNFEKNSQCNKAICETKDIDDDGYVKCHMEGKTETFQCVYSVIILGSL